MQKKKKKRKKKKNPKGWHEWSNHQDEECGPSLTSRHLSWMWGWGPVRGGIGQREMGVSPLDSLKVFSLAPLTLRVEARPCCHILAPIKYFCAAVALLQCPRILWLTGLKQRQLHSLSFALSGIVLCLSKNRRDVAPVTSGPHLPPTPSLWLSTLTHGAFSQSLCDTGLTLTTSSLQLVLKPLWLKENGIWQVTVGFPSISFLTQ